MAILYTQLERFRNQSESPILGAHDEAGTFGNKPGTPSGYGRPWLKWKGKPTHPPRLSLQCYTVRFQDSHTHTRELTWTLFLNDFTTGSK